MSRKWKVEELKIGLTVETTFWANPIKESKFRFRATHLDGRRAPKVVLCDDSRIKPGVPCLVRVTEIKKPDRDDRGAVLVEFVKSQPMKLEGVYLPPMVSRKLQVLLESGLNILLDGPQGCGKTVLARTIAESLGMEFVFFNCGAVIEATDFLATVQVRASDSGQPVMDFIKTEVLLALEQAGRQRSRAYLIFLDEFNRCQESARNALMPALDSSRRIFNPVDNSFIEIPDNVQFIAAVNRGREFSGVFGIDAAQLDRFAPLRMDYLPPEEEVKLLQQRHPEVSKAVIGRLVKAAHAVRQSPDILSGLSVRATEEACIYLKHPLFQSEQSKVLPEVLRTSFCGRFNGEPDDVTTDAGAVWAIVRKTLAEKSAKA